MLQSRYKENLGFEEPNLPSLNPRLDNRYLDRALSTNSQNRHSDENEI